MLTVREIGLLKNIIKHCTRIAEKMAITSLEQYNEDEDVREIICFNIFQIGELAKNFTPQFVKDNNGVPWSQIKGMRDKIGHGYGTIDLVKVWKTAEIDVPPLQEYCQKLLEENGVA